jgi:transcriptional regulator with XRE-family HTH domain
MNLDQRDLAEAAEVTESYISQLLARKKAPPAPKRTDIYEKIGAILDLPPGELSNLAESQRKEELRKRIADPPQPRFEVCREVILNSCQPSSQAEVRRIFEKDSFGELERLVTQTLLRAAQGFQKSDVFQMSEQNCISILEPAIRSWDIDLATFAMHVLINGQVAAPSERWFEYKEMERDFSTALEPGLVQFLSDKSLSSDATEEEVEFLKALKVKGRRPSALYYYRELQNLRDPLHFQT